MSTIGLAMIRKRVGNGNGYASDRLINQQFVQALRELAWQRECGRTMALPTILLTPEGLRKIVAMMTRGREVDTRDLELLKDWADAYHEEHP